MQLKHLFYPQTKYPKDAWWKLPRLGRKCGKKNCYPYKLAVSVRDERQAKTNKKLSVYECPKCLSWHLTSHPK